MEEEIKQLKAEVDNLKWVIKVFNGIEVNPPVGRSEFGGFSDADKLRIKKYLS